VAGGGGGAVGLRKEDRENGQKESGESHELHHDKEIGPNKTFFI
jgi:hypothetical protein